MESIELDESMERRCTLYSVAEYEESYRNNHAFTRLPPEEQRKQREHDRRDFPDLFWLGPLASGTAGQSGREELVRIRAFIRANGLDEGREVDSAELEELILEAVEDDQLVPVIDRNEETGWINTLPASTQSSGLSDVLVREARYPFSAMSRYPSHEPILSGPYDPGVQEAKLKAAREAAGGAFGGADGDSIDNPLLKSFSDSDSESSSLGDAQPFEYVPDEPSGDTTDLAASTSSPDYAAQMLGYDRKTFGKMIHAMKDEHDLGGADNVIWHDDGSVYFQDSWIDNMHNYGP